VRGLLTGCRSISRYHRLSTLSHEGSSFRNEVEWTTPHVDRAYCFALNEIGCRRSRGISVTRCSRFFSIPLSRDPKLRDSARARAPSILGVEIGFESRAATVEIVNVRLATMEVIVKKLANASGTMRGRGFKRFTSLRGMRTSSASHKPGRYPSPGSCRYP
jgi:hypothetical protein